MVLNVPKVTVGLPSKARPSAAFKFMIAASHGSGTGLEALCLQALEGLVDAGISIFIEDANILLGEMMVVLGLTMMVLASCLAHLSVDPVLVSFP